MKEENCTVGYVDELVKEVKNDFESRRNIRKTIEAKWLLNLNFMLGNQYCNVERHGIIADCGKRYDWEEHEVYNHIAPIIESRLAKFARVNCAVNVRPVSGTDNDINVAKLASRLIEGAQADNNFVTLAMQANYWSEVTGTSFYKVVWTGNGINITVCPPYEIYPDTLGATDVDKCRSIIHARAYSVDAVEAIWGKRLRGGDVNVINMSTTDNLGGRGLTAKGFKLEATNKSNHVIVIERYELPSAERPNGRLVIVAEDELLYEGELPYANGINAQRGFPFIRQVSSENPAGFYGVSIIERLIPVQRAYNAVKNRKHELLNRLAAGVLAVEDGSVDMEALEEEGLAPGRVIAYRQGSTPPFMMSAGTVPSEFKDEEDRLLSEFVSISGVSDYAGGSVNAGTISGYALSLLIEQDYSRLSVTTESIRAAVKEVCKQILRLYRQFTNPEDIMAIIGEGCLPEVLAFTESNLGADDIVMEADSEMVETPAVRRSMVFDLLQNGLLSDENGKISNRNRAKILEMLGFGNWESARRTEEIHIQKCATENVILARGEDPGIEELDDHDIHIEEHARYLISGCNNLSQTAKDALNAHVKAHKQLKKLAENEQASDKK